MESVNIPIGTSFDNKGIVDGEKALAKFGTVMNNTLKQMGSDKSMDELGKSVQTAFDMGLKGSTALMKRFLGLRQQAVKTVQEVTKLTTALAEQKKITDQTRETMSSVDNPDAQSAMKKLMSSGEKKTFLQYEDARKDSESQNRRYEDFKKENQAALEGLEIQRQCAAYREMEKALIRQNTEYQEKYNKMVAAHQQQEAEYFAKFGLKDFKAMNDKNKGVTNTGEKSDIRKGYDALKEKQRAESRAFEASMPKASEKLENLRATFSKFMETYRSQLEKVDANFGEKDIIKRISSVQSWVQKLNARLETGADGVRRLTSETVEEEQRLLAIAQDCSEEYRMLREVVKDIFASHVEETQEVQEQVRKEEEVNEQLKIQQQLLKANAKEQMSASDAAQTGVDNKQDIPENYNFKDALKQVFSWQRVFTIIGKLVNEAGEKLTDLSKKIAGLLVNIGKLGVAMMKAFGSGMVKGVVTIGKTLGNIKTHFKDMIPSTKKVAQFLVKYIFGFRTMYFLVRKVRQAIGEGIKAIAKADKDVNKSISALQMALNQLKGQLGASFAPVIQPVVSLLVKVINLATKATVQIGAFLATLTGKHTIKVATAKNVDYAKSLDKTSGSAKKAAKAIKAYLSPLDELNRMDDPNKDNGSGGGGAGTNPDDLGVTFKNMNIDKLGISQFAKKLKAAWKKQDWEGVGKVISDELAKVLGKIEKALDWKNVEKKVGKFTDIVSGIVNGISKNKKMWENLGKAVGTGLNTAMKTINQLVRKINWSSIGSGIATALGEAVKKIDPKTIAQFIENKFIVILDLLSGFMDKMKKDGTWTEIATKLIKALNDVDWRSIALKTFNFVGSIFGAITDLFIGFISQGGFSKLVEALAQGINESIAKLTPEDFKRAGAALSSTLLVLFGNLGKLLSSTSGSGQKILDGIRAFFEGINWESVLTDAGDIAASLANGLVSVFGTIGELLNTKGDDGTTLAQKMGEKIGNAIKKIDFKALGTAFGNFGEAIIEGIMSAIKSADLVSKLQEFFNGVFASNSPLLQNLMSATPWLALGGAILSGIGKALPLVLSANQATGGKLASLIGQWFGNAGAVSGSAGAGVQVAGNIAAVGVAIAGVKTTITGCTDAWNLLTGKMSEADFGGINKDITSVGDAIKNVATDSKQARLTFALGFQKVGDGIANVMNKVNSLITGVDAFTGEKVPSIKGALEGIGKKFSDFGAHVSKLWGEVKTTWNTGIKGIKDALGSIPGKAKEAWEGIKTAFAHVADWFKDKFEKAWEGVKNVFSTGGQIFSGIKEGLEKTFKTVVNKIIDGMNTIIKKPFDKLNDIITTLKGIEVLGAKPFKNFKTISVPQIPKLAQGAVIPASKPFLAMLGDQKSGNNIEAPESLIRQIVREEAGGNNGKTTVVAKVGRRELFEIVLEEAKIRQQTTGRNPFEFT